jgi:hypothetical protein
MSDATMSGITVIRMALTQSTPTGAIASTMRSADAEPDAAATIPSVNPRTSAARASIAPRLANDGLPPALPPVVLVTFKIVPELDQISLVGVLDAAGRIAVPVQLMLEL